jgi:hypothetical protein
MSATDRPNLLDAQRRSLGPTCVSDLTLDRVALGETNDTERAAVAAHLATCDGCTRASAVLAEDRAGFAREAAVANLAVDAMERSSREAKRIWKRVLLRRLIAPLAMGGAVALITFFAKPHSETRTKGEFSLSPYVLHPESGAAGNLHLGEPLHPGDRLQFRYNGGQRGYLAIVAVDAAGQVAAYYPSGTTAAPVEAGHDVDLQSAVELDGTLGREVIVGLRCQTAVAMDAILAATRKAASDARAHGGEVGALGLPCVETRHQIDKRARPAP